MDSLSSSGRSATPVFDKVIRPPTDDRVPPVEPHMPPAAGSHQNRSFETNIPDTNSANNADLFGTLPRRKTQKSQDHVRMCNNQKLESEVYQDYLENQRRQTENVNHSRSSSGARTPVNELESDLINVPNVRYENSNQQPYNCVTNQQTQQVVRPYPDVNSGITYSRMSQGLKPIPVAPPRIENQSQHTEVGNQTVFQLGAVSATEPNGFQSSNENDGSEHGWYGDEVRRSSNGEYLTHQRHHAQPSPRAFNSTLASYIRTKSSKPLADTSRVAPSAAQTSHSQRLQGTQVNQCDLVPAPPAHTKTPVALLLYECVGRDWYQSSISRRKLNRSASFSHPVRLSANTSQTAPLTGTNIVL